MVIDLRLAWKSLDEWKPFDTCDPSHLSSDVMLALLQRMSTPLGCQNSVRRARLGTLHARKVACVELEMVMSLKCLCATVG